MSAYIFVLCPPYSGSTILWRLLATSDAVSALADEGLRLPHVHRLIEGDPWDSDYPLPWDEIQQVWSQIWDPTKPLRIEKSPPHLVRLSEIFAKLGRVYAVVMVRDPYAHCEGLMRRGLSARRAAEFSMFCLRQQARNRKLEPSLSFTYEDLTDRTEETCERLRGFLPALGKLKHRREFVAHSFEGFTRRPIVNLKPATDRPSEGFRSQVHQLRAARP